MAVRVLLGCGWCLASGTATGSWSGRVVYDRLVVGTWRQAIDKALQVGNDKTPMWRSYAFRFVDDESDRIKTIPSRPAKTEGDVKKSLDVSIEADM